jgi:hypothetical protein
LKKVICLLALVVLAGCAPGNGAMEQALQIRSDLLGATQVSFDAKVSADYIDHVEQFTLRCQVDEAGAVRFEVIHPAAISGITGSVAGQQGTLTFDDTVLAFPLMAQERLSPVSGPWVMMQALRSGQITACAEEDGLLHLTVDDRYGEDPLTLEIWIRGDAVAAAEIAWRGMRQMTMELEQFTIHGNPVE